MARPKCPKCGGRMVMKRTRKPRRRAEGWFWSCRDFPWCRGSRDVTPEDMKARRERMRRRGTGRPKPKPKPPPKPPKGWPTGPVTSRGKSR